MIAPALLLAALAPLPVVSTPAVGDHLALHPEEASFAICIPDVPAMIEAYGGTAWARLLAEPEMEGALALLEGELGGMQLESALGLTGQPWSELLDSVRAVSISGPSMEEAFELFGTLASPMGGLPSAKALLLLEAADEAAAQALSAAIREQMGAIAADAPGGWVAANDGGPELRCAIRGGLLELGLGGSVAAPEGARSSAARFEAREGTVIMEARLAPQWEMAPGMGDLLQTLGEGFMGPWFTMASRGGDWRVVLDGDRFHTDGRFLASEGARVLGGKPLQGPSLPSIEGAAVQMSYSVDPNGLARLLGVDGMAGPEAEAIKGLVSTMAGRLDISMSNKVSVLSAPPILVTAPVEDEGAAGAGLAALMGMMEQQLMGAATVSQKPYRKVPIYTLAATEGVDLPLELPLPIDLAGLVKPSFAVAEGQLMISTNASQLKRAIRARGKEAKGAYPVREGSGLATQEDWMEVLASVYDGVLGLVGGLMGGMAASLEEFDAEMPANPLDALPSSDLLRKHFRPASRWRRLEGETVRYHSESSFGPEFLAVIPGVAFMTLGVESTVEEPMVLEDELFMEPDGSGGR